MSDALDDVEDVVAEVEGLRRQVEDRRRANLEDQTKVSDGIRRRQLEIERDSLKAELEAMDSEDDRRHPDAHDPVKYAESLMNEAAGIVPTDAEKQAAEEEAIAEAVAADDPQDKVEARKAFKAPAKSDPTVVTTNEPEGGNK